MCRDTSIPWFQFGGVGFNLSDALKIRTGFTVGLSCGILCRLCTGSIDKGLEILKSESLG